VYYFLYNFFKLNNQYFFYHPKGRTTYVPGDLTSYKNQPLLLV